ncbi:NACHT, LRR and PYD domains-containing protein 14-like isoform X1 [Syngnathus acus]|uniref:NACHT, LRR and PYD domains-containing protein 14-like isoform X1 n=1 Tax=Syngnathus acus TaxID=161584 RepID=UPI001885C961|nr:NACHT, LRR and PYD domains-containing protein 14-like isoform X1 [Syngnathus acus]XP_037116903.1 NACHT, LRR and PYD domains-containing protein 14-like isoform X1 [Syngnathus acus]XP_037116923.1 NACHT, LRR and PYD domains-containing protein 14-like isoform X1 [Syngnathus acus]XP_037116931.1 NACHT, LRR and PYD domains-containing protein 14-like isoform X1 [Syngnathus acus]
MEETDVQRVQRSLKSTLKKKYHRHREALPVNAILPSRLHHKTNLKPNSIQQHEVSSVDKSDLRTWLVGTTVLLEDIVNCDCKHGTSQRTFITFGVCGVGKTTAVQTFALDWANGNRHQGIHLLLPFSFWELNLIKRKVSFIELIHMFYPNLQRLTTFSLNECNILFVFDGLDEYHLSLNFRCTTVSDIFEAAPVDTLLTNLIKGNLFPKAHLWITTRYTAATKIPECYLLERTVVRGFDDEQKELHIRSVIGSDHLTKKAFDHVKISRSLNFLCQIPPICTIMATALKNLLKADDDFKITHFTLTQLYIEIVKMANSEFISKLKRLALDRLEEEFDYSVLYRDDLLRSKISVEEASLFSKESPLLLREEKGLHDTTVFRFGHLSVQEFLAADCRLHEIGPFQSSYLSLVDQTLESKNGKYDIFLRFIFGLMKEQGSMNDSHPLFVCTRSMILTNIMSPIAVVLFHCLREFDLKAFLWEVDFFLTTGICPDSNFSPTHWALMAKRVTNFEGCRETVNMPVSKRCDEQVLGNLPDILKSRKAILRFSNLTNKCCPAFASVLRTSESYLRELDLGYNSITDTGVKMLVKGLTSQNCSLKKLRLLCCEVTAEGCRYLAIALKKCGKLQELDLSGNHLGDEGLKHLADGLKCLECHLQVLKICQCNFGQRGCSSLALALQKNPTNMGELNLAINHIGDKGANELFTRYDISMLTKLQMNCCGITTLSCKNIGEALKSESSNLVELNLSNNQIKDAGFELICTGMYAWSCLEILNVSRCGITTSGCCYISKVLGCVSQLYSHGERQTEWQAAELRELNLTMNTFGDAGVKEITAGLMNPYSHFKSLNLSHCNLTDNCCSQLASVLSSTDSPIRELDLSDNDIQDKGTKKLCTGLKSTQCMLEKLALANCNIHSRGVSYLTAALMSNPRYLTELLLIGNKLTSLDITNLIELTKRKEYALHTLDVSEY